jgi:riboflavin kinase
LTALGTGATRQSLERRLAGGGLVDAFDVIVTRADVERGKPAPDIFLEVARRLEVAPADCLVLEDSPHGCEAALAAGMQIIACPSVVNAHCEFPDGVRVVASLLEVSLDVS